MKISQEDEMILNLYLSKRYGAQRMLNEFPDNGWTVGNIESQLKWIHKMGTIVWQPGSGSPRSSLSSGGTCAQSGEQAKKAPISSWDFA